MEAQSQSFKQLAQLAQKLDGKPPMECKNIIHALSPEELNAILDALVELVKGGMPSEKNPRLIANCLSFFPQKEVFRFLQRIRTGKLLQQLCSFFNKIPDFYYLIRICKILLTYLEDNVLLDKILTILNEKRVIGVPIGIQVLNFLEKEMSSPKSSEMMTVDLRKKILTFLCSMGEQKLRMILKIEEKEKFSMEDWISETTKIIARYEAQQSRSE